MLLRNEIDNIVPVRRAGDGLPARSSGRGNGFLDVRTLNIANNPFKPGDIMVTSGTGGLYPPNIPVAIVVSRQDDGALARPLADPGKVNAVAVLRPYTIGNAWWREQVVQHVTISMVAGSFKKKPTYHTT